MDVVCDTGAANWLPAPTPVVRPGRVAVYRRAVPATGPVPGQQLLSAAELARAARFHHPADQRRYLTARGLRREVLGACAGLAPATLAFTATTSHKPTLAAAPEVHFSISHAGAWVLLAVATAAVGIDLELLRTDFAVADLLAGNFSAAETRLIGGHDQLLQAWTRKEALAKALGWGIDERFASLPGLPGRYALPGAGEWHVRGFATAPGHVGAVAYPSGYALDWWTV